MKRITHLATAIVWLLGTCLLPAQVGGGMGGSPGGPSLSGEMLKLFGDHKVFSAHIEFEVRQDDAGAPVTMPGTIAFSDGNTRFDMDLTQARGAQIPPQAIAQLKQMGMDKLAMISLPGKEESFLVYPNLEAYVKLPINDPDAKADPSDYSMEVTELGKDDAGGYACIKNKVVVTDKEGNRHESTVWNATSLKQFPVRIETTEDGQAVALLFTDVKLSKPEAKLFSPPSTFKGYDDVMGMMQEIMMKRMKDAAGAPEAK